MKTAGYDIVLLLNEDILNQVSGAIFYNNFLTFNGTKDFRTSLTPDKINQIPGSLRDFLEIRYRFKLLHEPYMKFKDGNKVEISAKLRVYIWMLQGLELKFDASLTMETPLEIDISKKKIGNVENQNIKNPKDKDKNECQIVLKSADIREFKIDYGYSASENVTLQLKTIFEDALRTYLDDTSIAFAINLPTINAQLPYADINDANRIPVDIKAVKIVNNSTLAIAANLFDYDGGNANDLNEFARNCNVGVGISEKAMNKVYDFFWEKTNWDKRYHKVGTFKINMVDKVLDILTELVNFIVSTSVKIASLGFLETNMDFISSDFEYTVDLDFKTKPTFDIQNGNRV